MRRALPLLLLAACTPPAPTKKEPFGVLPSAVTSAEPLWIPFSLNAGQAFPDDPREKRLFAVRRLTFDGASGKPRWAPDGQSLVYETGGAKGGCRQLERVRLVDGKTTPVVTGALASSRWGTPVGTATLIVAAEGAACEPPKAPFAWALVPGDLAAVRDGAPPAPLLPWPGYDGDLDANAAGTRIVFSSLRDGDLEIYVAAPDGTQLARVTHEPGFDGDASLSPDGSKVVWAAERPGDAGLAGYKERLAAGQAAPEKLQVMLAGSLGQHPRVLAAQGSHSAGPSFLPDSRRVLYASTMDSAERAGDGGAVNVEIYLVDPEAPVTATGGPRVERVTFGDGFDGEARISPDGRYLAFTSSRAAAGTDVFVARFRDDDED